MKAILIGGPVLGLAVLYLAIYAIGAFRQRLLDDGDAKALAAIVPPIRRFDGADDGLRKRTEARRRAAEAMKRQARQVEAGGQAAPVDVLVPGRRRA